MKLRKPSLGVNDVGVEDFNCGFTCNGASDPAATSVLGGAVSSVTRSATGKYIVTLAAGCFAKEIPALVPYLDADSTGDGAYASVYCPDKTASPLVFHVFTHAASGTKTDYSARTAGFRAAFKVSGVGS